MSQFKFTTFDRVLILTKSCGLCFMNTIHTILIVQAKTPNENENSLKATKLFSSN